MPPPPPPKGAVSALHILSAIIAGLLGVFGLLAAGAAVIIILIAADTAGPDRLQVFALATIFLAGALSVVLLSVRTFRRTLRLK